MKSYIGTKIIQARPMTRGEYNEYRGWTIPANENPDDPGYLVKYDSSYESWSPKAVFELAYREVTANEKTLVSGNDAGNLTPASGDTPAEPSGQDGEAPDVGAAAA